MTEWTVKVPGSEHQLTTEEMRIWAAAGRISGDTQVVDANGTSWLAKQVPGVFSKRDWVVALVLSIFLGVFGVDRFYLGKVGTGITKLLVNLVTLYTAGLLWWIIDIVLIATKKLQDKEGYLLS